MSYSEINSYNQENTMTTRDKLFVQPIGAPATFASDNLAPNLPLPNLAHTLEQYYKSLLPFGTAAQLDNSRKQIDQFRNGIGKKLQSILEERSKTNRNWLEKWWEKHAYCTDRTPILPSKGMAAIILTEVLNIDESSEYRLKATARLIYSSMEYFELLRTERLKQDSVPNGSVMFSMNQYRRLFNSVRIPGSEVDTIKSYFKTASEGEEVPRNVILILRGRIFSVNFFNKGGDLMAATEILEILEKIFSLVGSSKADTLIPLLSCDDRSSWAKNCEHLRDLSPRNKEFLELIERSIMVVSFDEHCPCNWNIAQHLLSGDLHSKLADKSFSLVSFKNGRFGCIGEHSCYDGTIFNSLRLFYILSMLGCAEPDWSKRPFNVTSNLMEITFDVDERLKSESKRVMSYLKQNNNNNVIISSTSFQGYGINFLKKQSLYADAYVQNVIQLTYYKIHSEFAPTYETALMRRYYNGRTETVRSFTQCSVNWILSFLNEAHSSKQKFEKLKEAINAHQILMNNARNGMGIDRHLFGLWCASLEIDIETPDLYKDPLYRKSGGDCNFVLSTSTLGYSSLLRSGFVAPMVKDGYGVFYTFRDESIWLEVTAFTESQKTNAHKFAAIFDETMLEVKKVIELATLVPKL